MVRHICFHFIPPTVLYILLIPLIIFYATDMSDNGDDDDDDGDGEDNKNSGNDEEGEDGDEGKKKDANQSEDYGTKSVAKEGIKIALPKLGKKSVLPAKDAPRRRALRSRV